MAMIACKECGNDVSSQAKVCPKCGIKVPRAKKWPWVLMVLLVLFVLMVAIGSQNVQPGSADKRATIALCWEDQKTKSFAPNTQRFVAATCERMERDFQTQYGYKP